MTTYSAVGTTGIYCRPGYAAKPLAQNVRTFDHPAAAEDPGHQPGKGGRTQLNDPIYLSVRLRT